ncbi:MAG: DEAD/DEAH box helicase [Citromicrobium sp.]|nr:MAG: DEAD/DEAH box helicase [Citromicrobium sp.]
MTSLQPSNSDKAGAFDRLHPTVRRWIREQGWARLREVQVLATTAILDTADDVLISAATAAGKTEAAFLPLLGISSERQLPGVSILYVAPLKALINDQFRRLEDLVRWHGDAPQGPKNRTMRSPAGVVLITPESIEAMLLRRQAAAEALFGSLDAIVIDELHAFLKGPRGLHLSSLLRRIEVLNERRPRRVGLSATIGDLEVAAHWMSATARTPVRIVSVAGSGPPLRLQVRSYVEPPERDDADPSLVGDEEQASALAQIADHAFGALRGANNLFFAGSRTNVEALADRLRFLSEEAEVPNEFFPHHGSLGKALREDLELRLKDGRLPTTAVATTTLELGIDIGSVVAVSQLGAPRSLASLRQRLGRSRRREGASAIFRNYLREPYPAADADPLDTLHLPVVQSVAAMNLLRDRFVEPPEVDAALLSVAVHQILSLIVQQGARRASELYQDLCVQGPFAAIEKSDFADLLRGLNAGEHPLIEQSPDGAIMLGPMGERLTSSRDFYANFATDEEWRLVNGGRTLGTLPIVNTLVVGSIIAFAGRRWRATEIDDRGKVVEVEAHRMGRIPKFDRLGQEPIHDRLAAEMLAVLEAVDEPGYLDAVSSQSLREARSVFVDRSLSKVRFLDAGDATHVLTWRGTVVNSLLAVLLTSIGFDCETFDVGITLTATPSDLADDVISSLDGCPPIEDLARFVENLSVEKYDAYVPEAILRRFWVQRHAHLRDDVSALLEQLAGADRDPT